MITVLRDITAQQVEIKNDTEMVKVSLIGFDDKTQDMVGGGPTIALIYFEFTNEASEIQHNGTRNI